MGQGFNAFLTGVAQGLLRRNQAQQQATLATTTEEAAGLAQRGLLHSLTPEVAQSFQNTVGTDAMQALLATSQSNAQIGQVHRGLEKQTKADAERLRFQEQINQFSKADLFGRTPPSPEMVLQNIAPPMPVSVPVPEQVGAAPAVSPAAQVMPDRVHKESLAPVATPVPSPQQPGEIKPGQQVDIAVSGAETEATQRQVEEESFILRRQALIDPDVQVADAFFQMTPAQQAFMLGQPHLVGSLTIQHRQMVAAIKRGIVDQKIALAEAGRKANEKKFFIVDTVDEVSGQPIKAFIGVLPDGRWMNLGRMKSSNKNDYLQLLNDQERIENEIIDPNTSEARRNQLERRMVDIQARKDKLNRDQFFKPTELVTIPFVEGDKTTFVKMTPKDAATIDKLMMRAALLDPQRIRNDQETVTRFNQALNLGERAIKMVEDNIESFGPSGLLIQAGQTVQSLIGQSKILGHEIKAFLPQMMNDLEFSLKNLAPEQQQQLKGLVKNLDTTRNALEVFKMAIAMEVAKAKDPNSVVRPSELQVQLEVLDGYFQASGQHVVRGLAEYLHVQKIQRDLTHDRLIRFKRLAVDIAAGKPVDIEEIVGKPTQTPELDRVVDGIMPRVSQTEAPTVMPAVIQSINDISAQMGQHVRMTGDQGITSAHLRVAIEKLFPNTTWNAAIDRKMREEIQIAKDRGWTVEQLTQSILVDVATAMEK
jgi:hypothetical protein